MRQKKNHASVKYFYLASDDIQSDPAILLEACDYIPDVLERVTDRGFIYDALARNPRLFYMLPYPVQRRCPELAFRTLQQFQKEIEPSFVMDNFDFMASDFVEETWYNREFVLKWFEAGFPFLPIRSKVYFPTEWRNDKEIFIRIARHGLARFRYDSFGNASEELRNDKKFMLRVLEAAPSLCGHVAQSLRNDFDLCLLAFSGPRRAANDEVLRRRREGGNNLEYKYLAEFKSVVSDHLD